MEDADKRLEQAKEKQAKELLVRAEQHRLEKEDRMKHQQISLKKHEYLQHVHKKKIAEEDKEFKQYINKKEKLKKKRIKALFDAESKRGEVRQALNEMAIWNAFDNDIIIKYEEYCKKEGSNACTVSEFVRKMSAKIHEKEKKELKQLSKQDKQKQKEEEEKKKQDKLLSVQSKAKLKEERRSRRSSVPSTGRS